MKKVFLLTVFLVLVSSATGVATTNAERDLKGSVTSPPITYSPLNHGMDH
ncbi:hypothetical protein GCM10008013_40840 [Paenibacillus segetis]|uniref:Uncharacterized protein n=1 Tax=Paenibacillus segetis TaxID=1325360 RepID=A0ABQ1YQP6_9BACL|nr:hypothetical protein GCM10008013_40840 [Paenibacillus segetis]